MIALAAFVFQSLLVVSFIPAGSSRRVRRRRSQSGNTEAIITVVEIFDSRMT